jgi:hypothetical protein
MLDLRRGLLVRLFLSGERELLLPVSMSVSQRANLQGVDLPGERLPA